VKLRNDNTILINDITNTIEKEVKEITNSNNNSDSDSDSDYNSDLFYLERRINNLKI